MSTQVVAFTIAASLMIAPAVAGTPIDLSTEPPKAKIDSGPSLSLGSVGRDFCVLVSECHQRNRAVVIVAPGATVSGVGEKAKLSIATTTSAAKARPRIVVKIGNAQTAPLYSKVRRVAGIGGLNLGMSSPFPTDKRRSLADGWAHISCREIQKVSASIMRSVG